MTANQVMAQAHQHLPTAAALVASMMRNYGMPPWRSCAARAARLGRRGQ